MIIASAVNIGESVFFININNSSCYDSYIDIHDLDLLIFCVIRFLSHYLFMFGCLYIFRVQRIKLTQSLFCNDSEKSIVIAANYADDTYDDMRPRINASTGNNRH